MADVDKWIVPWIMPAVQYKVDSVELAWQHPNHARMFLNENPIPPSEKVLKAIEEMARYGNRYPHRWVELRRKLAEPFGLGPENVFLGNGSSEVIDNMVRVFCQPGDEVIIPDPTFSLFYARIEVNGAKDIRIPIREDDYQIDIDGMINAVTDRTKLMIVVNPNNPTGLFVDDKDLRRLLDLGIPTCIDEAYLEYDPTRGSKVPLIKEYPHAFVMKTFSKAYGLAGLRFGYMFGVPELVEAFDRIKLPWNVSILTLAAAEAALEDQEALSKKVEHNNKWMAIFTEEFRKLGLKPFPAHGNYMLVDANDFGYTSQEIVDMAFERGVILKKIGPIHGKNGFFRVTPGTDEECKRMLEVVKEIFSKPKEARA